MALSNAAASSATTMISSSQGGTTTMIPHTSATTNLIQQQKTHLPNPFALTDSQILDTVYLTHVNDDEICDTKILFDLVSNVILQSFSQIPLVSYKPEFHTLKLISCQMIATRNAPQCAHQTTMWILQYLRCYSWDAKALITLAAFSLEYGNFLYLHRVPTTDMLGTSLKQLNQVQERKVSADITELVTYILQAFQHIKEWATWSVEGYDYEEVPSLTDALQEIPVVVYWTIASIVAATGNLVGVSDYNLSYFRERLTLVVRRLVEYLTSCRTEIGRIDDYLTRRKVFEKPKDIVDLLKALIYRNGTQQDPQIYEGTVHIKSGLEVFKQKHVLLFISSLDSIGDEILLLNSVYERLQENPKEMKGFRKDDFKILWVPIVDVWDEVRKEQFRSWRSSINWYAVEYFFSIPGLRIIRDPEGLNYVGNPIIPVFNPQGILTNKDAMDLIFQWGIDAFPFREIDGFDLTLKWKWLWDVIRKAAPTLQVKGDRYIFIYGGNNKWVQDMTLELEKVKRHENIKRADVIIEYHQLGKDDPNSVSSFWIGIERKRQNKKFHQGTVDCEIQEIAKSLFCLKRDPQGWAILTKGSNIKLLGHGEPIYQTLVEFQNWKDKVLEKEGFDVAFKEYYDAKAKEISLLQPCSYLNVDNYSSASVIATITCPNPTCGRVMEVTSVNYKCCHRDDHNGGSFC